MTAAAIDPALTPEQIQAIAEEAYLYAYPMLVAYGFFHRQTRGPDAPERQAVNRFTHFRTLASPTLNNTIPWVNTDTLYSAVWLDLRREPMALTTPAMAAHRFHDIQANDWYTMAFVTRGTRDRGNGTQTYLLAGPDWQGETPPGVDEVIRAESRIIKLFARIVVEGPGDEVAIHALQDSYQLRPLSAFLGQPAPPGPEDIEFPKPAPEGLNRGFYERATPDFIADFNFLMTLAAVHPDERPLFDSFARIGAVPGAPFDANALSVQDREAIQRGIDTALARIARRLARLGEPVNGWVYPLDLRGGREVLAGSSDAFMRRAVVARYAIWGPAAEEVVYMTAETDCEGQALDGASRAYRLHFDRPPPAKGFWSFTVYDAATRLLVAHPSGRYKLGDRDRDVVRDSDGGLTLYLQHEEPAPALRANWLPVPGAPFQVVARLYWPDAKLLDGRYQPPPLRPAPPA